MLDQEVDVWIGEELPYSQDGATSEKLCVRHYHRGRVQARGTRHGSLIQCDDGDCPNCIKVMTPLSDIPTVAEALADHQKPTVVLVKGHPSDRAVQEIDEAPDLETASIIADCYGAVLLAVA